MVNDFYNKIKKALDEVDGDVVESVYKRMLKYQQQPEVSCYEDLAQPGRVFIIGNGGSCAIAEHISTDLNKRCRVKAHTLSNNSLATCLANDYGYINTLSKWMELKQFGKDDFLIAISSSGKSNNILNAIQYATNNFGSVFAIFGMNGSLEIGEEDQIENYFIHIDSHNYGVIELTTEIILHGIVEDLVLR